MASSAMMGRVYLAELTAMHIKIVLVITGRMNRIPVVSDINTHLISIFNNVGETQPTSR